MYLLTYSPRFITYVVSVKSQIYVIKFSFYPDLYKNNINCTSYHTVCYYTDVHNFIHSNRILCSIRYISPGYRQFLLSFSIKSILLDGTYHRYPSYTRINNGPFSKFHQHIASNRNV